MLFAAIRFTVILPLATTLPLGARISPAVQSMLIVTFPAVDEMRFRVRPEIRVEDEIAGVLDGEAIGIDAEHDSSRQNECFGFGHLFPSQSRKVRARAHGCTRGCAGAYDSRLPPVHRC